MLFSIHMLPLPFTVFSAVAAEALMVPNMEFCVVEWILIDVQQATASAFGAFSAIPI